MPDEPKRAGRAGDAPWTERERAAHDVRTQITVIKVRTQLLRRRLRRGSLDAPDLDAALKQIELATARLERIVGHWERGTADPADSVHL